MVYKYRLGNDRKRLVYVQACAATWWIACFIVFSNLLSFSDYGPTPLTLVWRPPLAGT